MRDTLHRNGNDVISEDAKVLEGDGANGDPDLVLHYAMRSAAGRVVGTGPPSPELFVRVPEPLILDQLVDELSWAAEHTPGKYAVLNACRAWRFANDRAVVSKGALDYLRAAVIVSGRSE